MLQDEMPMVNFHLGLAMSVDADHVVHLNFGDGLVARFLARFGCDVTAVSADANAMETLRFRKYSSRVTWVIDHWTDGAVSDELESADLVIATGPDTGATLPQLHAAMRYGATLCLTQPGPNAAKNLRAAGFDRVRAYTDWDRSQTDAIPVAVIALRTG